MPRALEVQQRSLSVPDAATTLSYAVATGSSKQSAAIADAFVVIHSDVDVYCVQGENPAAFAPVADGAAGGVRLKAGESYRVPVAAVNNKLAFCAVTTAGTVEITPGA